MTRNDRIKVLVVHSDNVAEAGLSAIVARDLDMQLVQAPNEDASDEAVSLVCADKRVAVVIADYSRALRLADLGRKLVIPGGGQPPRLLVFTDRATHAEIRAALAAGIQGYLLSGCSAQDVTEGVRQLFRGMRHLSELATLRLVEDMLSHRLTPRETEVLSLVATGFPNKLIADQLGVELPTVKVHVAAILEKLGARNRTEAVAIANQRGLFAALPGSAPAGSPGLVRDSPHQQALDIETRAVVRAAASSSRDRREDSIVATESAVLTPN